MSSPVWQYLGSIAFTDWHAREYRDQHGIIYRVETRRDSAGFSKGKPKTCYFVEGSDQTFEKYDDALASKK